MKLYRASRLLPLLPAVVALANADRCAASAEFPVGDFPKFIISADLRNNGEMDIITANYHGASISVLLGNGNGTFQTESSYPVGQFPTGLAVADLNGDGIPDIVVANAIDPTGPEGGVNQHSTSCPSCQADAISVLLGNGDGTFQPGVFWTAVSGTAWVSVYDFNGDGKPDIVAAAWKASMISVLIGNGNGTFQPAVNYATGMVPHSIALGDYNGDGKMDLAVGNMYSADVSIFFGNGNGTFTSAGVFPVASMPHSIVTDDFNGDGILDLATANEIGTISVLIGNGDGTFQPVVNYESGSVTTSVVAGDFSGNGILDLAAANAGPAPTSGIVKPATGSGEGVAIFMGKGDGTFNTPVYYYTGGPGSNGVTATTLITGSKTLDLAFDHYDSYVTAIFGTGTGSFTQLPQ
jgi:hypothetical protein